MKGLLKTIFPDKEALTTFAVLGGANLILIATAWGVKLSNESKGYVGLPHEGGFETKMAYKTRDSQVYDMCNVSFMATPRGGVGCYNRPLTLSESNLVNSVEVEAK
jgi:hypothetical protein